MKEPRAAIRSLGERTTLDRMANGGVSHQLALWGPAPGLAPVGQMIKRRRIDVRLTQATLADALRVSQSTVSRLESGALTATFDDLVILARVLRVSIETLLGSSPLIVRRYRWTGRRIDFEASRRLATSFPDALVRDFLEGGGSLRALRAAREGRKPLTASQAYILLTLNVRPIP